MRWKSLGTEIWRLSEDFKVCDDLQYLEHLHLLKLNRNQILDWGLQNVHLNLWFANKREKYNNWFLLLGEIVETKIVIYIKHFCGEKKNETLTLDWRSPEEVHKCSLDLWSGNVLR